MLYVRALLVSLIVMVLAACENGRDKELVGTLLGAAAGAAIGSTIGSGAGNAVAIGVGALAGGVVGNMIGRSLDDQDREHAQQAARASIQEGQSSTTSTWSNPDTGNSGSYRPMGSTFEDENGQNCREVEQKIIVDGTEEVDQLIICENEDGTVVASN